MKHIITLIILLTTISDLCFCDKKYREQPAWDNNLNVKEIENELRTETIMSLKPMKKHLKESGKKMFFFHTVYVATLKNGLKAVWKPMNKHYNSYGEVAAYRASEWLGQRLIPPTVIKKHKGEKGSLQFFVQTSFDLLAHNKHKAFKQLSEKVKSDAQLYYFIFGQPDNHIGNQLIAFDAQGKAHLALIDNADIIIPNKSDRHKLSLSNMKSNKKRKHIHYPPSKASTLELKYPKFYSRATLDRYSQLSYEALKFIFEDALRDKVRYCSSTLFKKILKRKDHILNVKHKNLIP